MSPNSTHETDFSLSIFEPIRLEWILHKKNTKRIALVVAFSFESSGLRLTQSIRSNSHAGTRIDIEFLTPDPVFSLLTEQSSA